MLGHWGGGGGGGGEKRNINNPISTEGSDVPTTRPNTGPLRSRVSGQEELGHSTDGLLNTC